MEELHPAQIAAWRAMSPDQKWKLALAANHMVREGTRRRLHRQHPDWSDREIEAETARCLIRART